MASQEPQDEEPPPTAVGTGFHGRRAALKEIASWITKRNARRGVLVVTGAPGSGKSALLGQIATLRVPTGAVSCTVTARGRTADEVAEEIARSAHAPAPKRAGDLVPALRTQYGTWTAPQLTIVLDALDEAASPEDARAIVTRILVPLGEFARPARARIVTASGRHDTAGDLLAVFGSDAFVLDLEAPRFFARDDLAAHVRALLNTYGGGERFGSAYLRAQRTSAARIAACAEGNYLVAELTARAHAMRDQPADDPATLDFPTTVHAALDAHLALLPAVDDTTTARQACTALAFAEPPGMGIRPWRAAIKALYDEAPSEASLHAFAQSTTLVHAPTDVTQSYELSNQALIDALRADRARTVPPTTDEQQLALALLADGQAWGWAAAPPYTLRSLARHAARAGVIDHVLAEGDFRLYADLRRLIPAAQTAVTKRGREQAAVLRRTPLAIGASPETRAAMFSVTEACAGLAAEPAASTTPAHAPYRALWSNTAPHLETITLGADRMGTATALCTLRVDGRTLLAAGGLAPAAYLWDAATGEYLRALRGHPRSIFMLCALPAASADDRVLLAGSGMHEAAQVWDPATGEHLHTLKGHVGWVESLCAVSVNGLTLLATGGRDTTIRLCDAERGSQVRVIAAHVQRTTALCAIQVGDTTLLAAGGRDGTTRLFDPANGKLVRQFTQNIAWVSALCTVPAPDRPLLAAAGHDGTVIIWDPATGQQTQLVLSAHEGEAVNALCAVRTANRTLLASGGRDDKARLWDPKTGKRARELSGHPGPIHAMCAVPIGGRGRDHDLLATGSNEHMVRLWDPAPEGRTHSTFAVTHAVHTRQVPALCEIQVRDRSLLAAGYMDGTLELLDPATGRRVHTINRQQGASIHAVAAVDVASAARTLLATASPTPRLGTSADTGPGTSVHLWDPAHRRRVRTLESHWGEIGALCAVPSAPHTAQPTPGRTHPAGTLLAGVIARDIWLWNPASGERTRILAASPHRINALCAVQLAPARTILAAGDSHGQLHLLALPPDNHTPPTATNNNIRTDKLLHTAVTALCAIPAAGSHRSSLLATGEYDGVIRLWDLTDLTHLPRLHLEIPLPEPILSITARGRHIYVGLRTGALALELIPRDQN